MTTELLPQVGIGCHVEVELIDEQGDREQMSFDVVTASAADFARGLLSVDSPLGKAIRGKFEGTVVVYEMGDIRQVHIVRVQPAAVSAPADASQRRQAILDEARRKAERTNADMFASSFSGKWGDYTTDEMAEMDEMEE